MTVGQIESVLKREGLFLFEVDTATAAILLLNGRVSQLRLTNILALLLAG